VTTKLRIPHYFHSSLRRQMGELYASTAIADLALAVVLLFEPIFLFAVLKFSMKPRQFLYGVFDGLVELGRLVARNKDDADRQASAKFPFHIAETRRLYFTKSLKFNGECHVSPSHVGNPHPCRQGR
jgi:hypothetical protein